MASVIIDEQEFENVSLAITKREQDQGLKGIGQPTLMAFPYKQAGVRKFWMQETPKSLDIIFCRAGKVIYIGAGEPYNCDDKIGPNVACDLVLEAPKGFVDYHNISVGSSIRMRYKRAEIMKIIKSGSLLENRHDQNQIKFRK